jgi:hypothetical protein
MKTKRNKTIRNRKKRKSRRKYRKRGGDIRRQREQAMKDNFRNMFMNAFKRMQNNPEQAQSFVNSLKRHQNVINTLIPVTTNYIPISKQTYSESETPLLALVPMLSILLFHMREPALQKMFIQSFIQNKGNINLKSMTQNNNITALSTTIEMNDSKLAKYLLQHGADKNILTPEQQNQLSILVTGLPSIESVQKLIITEEVPVDGYAPDIEPEFWKPIFAPNEMQRLRETIHRMMSNDRNISPSSEGKMEQMWSVCQIIKAIIPTYYVPTSNEPYMSFGTYIIDQMVDFSHYNILLCAALLVYGIISYKMHGQDYDLLFKGGKATQLVLAGIEDMDEYKTEDIDILVMQKPNIPYDPIIIQKLSGHIAYLVKWFLQIPETPFRISVLVPNPENKRANPYIYKLSYTKQIKRADYRRQMMVDDFKPFSDIDFKETPTPLKPFFDKAVDYVFTIDELQTNISFRCPNLGALLDEKLYYYAKYKKIIKDNKPIPEEGLTIEECYRLLDKFKRTIVVMNRGLQKQRFAGLSEQEMKDKEKNTIKSKLEKLDIKEEKLVNDIIQDLTI